MKSFSILEILFVKKNISLVIFFLCLSLSHTAFALTTPSCSVASTGVNFGSYNVFSTIPTDSTGTISITCSAPWPTVTISIGASSNSGIFNPREMKNISGADTLNYNLFTDSSMSAIWGDGTGGSQTVVHGPNKKTQPETVYGRIFPGQDISQGYYADNLTVMITW
jgi:spore coat protein U domain-containing protein, fimbrial subunit CupE1/2/3/6